MHTVALAVVDGMLHFELSLAYEVFAADPTGVADPWYGLAVCGPAGSGWSPTTAWTGSRTPTP
ncbi:hypothetical protein NDW01_29890 [Actinoallomurus sp. WRP6H-15]|nr:hypothetical protein [Actinoallomurus soli]MCO5972623.1 hypothetical protein [Actinoallomurus soli]